MGVLQEEDLVLFGMSVLVFPKKGFRVSVSSLIFSQHRPRCVGKKNATSMGMFH